MQADQMPTVLKLSEVAEIMRCTERTVRRAVEAGTLRAIRLVPGGAPRFARSEVLALIEGKPRAQQRSHLTAWHERSVAL